MQLRESRGGGDASWDGTGELLGAPAGLDEVQEPEGSPLNKLLVWADNQDSMCAVETSFCRKSGKHHAWGRQHSVAGVFWG